MTAAASAVRARTATPGWTFGAGLIGASVVVGLLVGGLVSSGHAMAVFTLLAPVLVYFLWRYPAASPVVVLAAALTVEQFAFGGKPTPGATGPGITPSDYTDRIPLFHGLTKNIHVSPLDLLFVTLVGFWLLKRRTAATAPLRRTPLVMCVAAVLAAAFVGLLVGQTHHGSLRTAAMEIRPYAYLGLAFLLASVFATRRWVIRAALWAFVLGSGFKAVQAIHSFLQVRHQPNRPDFVVGHEEALFFALFILLTLSLWLFNVPGRLRTAATMLLPVVLLADLVNSRRTAWLILGTGIIVLATVALVALPARRRFLTRVLTLVTVFSIVYFPAYWNHTGALAGPARAVHSAVAPNARDESSDVYRVQENANLKLNIKEGGVLGKGFGVPIDYALPITDISSIDPLITYVPHNGVFYIFMRMGLFGGIAFWALIGTALITGCRLVRSRDNELAIVGMLTTCAIVGYAFEGYNDQGFFLYRVAIVIGCLLGLSEAARRFDAEPGAGRLAAAPVAARPAPDTIRRIPEQPARPPVMSDPVLVRSGGDRRVAERVARLLPLVLLPFAIGLLFWLLAAGAKGATIPPRQPTHHPAPSQVRR
jgi:hypothetical protein